MCQKSPIGIACRAGTGAAALLYLAATAFAQPSGLIRPDWRRIGNTGIDLQLAAPATGPVANVWFSADATVLFARTSSGQVFETKDFETWQSSTASGPAAEPRAVARPEALPEPGAKLVDAGGSSGRLYAFGTQVYRSDDGGRQWTNLTQYKRQSIIGGAMRDLAVSPVDPDNVAVANDRGVWRSADGGLSWSGLNLSLPNLPVRRILGGPLGTLGTRVQTDGAGSVEWAPGERLAWRPVEDPRLVARNAALAAARARLGETITTVASGEFYSYAGSADGELFVSTDQGATWRRTVSPARGAIRTLYVAPADSRVALAAGEAAPERADGSRVLRTINGGLSWDDLTANLPAGAVRGIAADWATGAIYLAASSGVYFTLGDLKGAGPATNWMSVGENLPAAAASDVLIDTSGNQVYVALEGYGVYATLAPHRVQELRVVSAGDLRPRPAAPGALLSVLGGRIVRAQAGLVDAPVLHADDLESQIQIPFEASGPTTRLALETGRSALTLDLPLQDTAPAIFVDRDGTPLLLDADSGLVLDVLNPGHSNGRVQVLATGLGKVRPSWTSGRAAPLETPPQVIAPVRAYIDGRPAEVTRATLAPGYVGFYLVEIQLPAIVDWGPAELRLEAGGIDSNRVRIYLEP